MLNDLAKAITLSAMFAAGIYALPADRPSVELQITTESGDVYAAGMGDTCADAQQGAVIPANWHSIICVYSN